MREKIISDAMNGISQEYINEAKKLATTLPKHKLYTKKYNAIVLGLLGVVLIVISLVYFK